MDRQEMRLLISLVASQDSVRQSGASMLVLVMMRGEWRRRRRQHTSRQRVRLNQASAQLQSSAALLRSNFGLLLCVCLRARLQHFACERVCSDRSSE